MIFKKALSQSTIEYVLLVAITIIALVVGANFVDQIKGGAFQAHFDAAKPFVAGETVIYTAQPEAPSNTGSTGNVPAGCESCPNDCQLWRTQVGPDMQTYWRCPPNRG
ncbi:MAG: hypothetical protein WC532_08730 [Candidatus Omnitrophota bacterium]